MADAQVRRFPAAAPIAARAAVDAALSARGALERALADLGRERERKVLEKIDAFLARPAFTPADAMRARLELETLRNAFDDQEGALRFWQGEASDRLTRLSADSWTEVLAALEARIAALRQREAEQQDEADAVRAAIGEIEALRVELQPKRPPSAGAPGRLPAGSARKGAPS
jgi:hypothetical protein